MRRFAVGVVVGIVIAMMVPVLAQHTFTSYGLGSRASCGTWTRDRLTAGTEKAINATWVSGFVSGYGYGNHQLRETDVAALVAFVDKYCTDHPLETVLDASAELVRELERSPR